MTETQHTQKLLSYLRKKLPGVYVKHSVRFVTGVPDLSITTGGHTWWFEAKLEDNWPPTALQQDMVDKLARHGGGRAGFLVYCWWAGRWRMLVRSHLRADIEVLHPGDTVEDDYDRLIKLLGGKDGMAASDR